MGLRNLLMEIHFAHAFCEISGSYRGEDPLDLHLLVMEERRNAVLACDMSVCLKI